MKELLQLIKRLDFYGLLIEQTNDSAIQLLRYCFVGSGAFIIDFGCYCLFVFLGMHYLIAGALAFIMAFAFNFMMSRRIVFGVSETSNIEAEALAAAVISIVGFVLTEILLYCCTALLSLDYRKSKIIATIVILFWNYAARKVAVYK